LRLDCALHCDAATVREGLLNVLGAGITRVGRLGFPAPLGTALALRLVLDAEEIAATHTVEVRFVQEEGHRQLFAMTAEFQVDVRDPPPTAEEDVAAAIALPLGDVILPSEGLYSFEVSFAGELVGSVRFRAHQT
jgi:hypothetical protein